MIRIIIFLMFAFSAQAEIGYASWYGKENRVGSTGKVLQHTKYPAAAHKTLPIGTKVLITHIKTNKTITAVIEDRGPYRKCRIIDLNTIAASQLGIIKDGVAFVKVQKI
jgi:rare lipoprotein A